MKINKYIGSNWFYHYYVDSKTGNRMYHGLDYQYLWCGIGYYYHHNEKGFWLI